MAGDVTADLITRHVPITLATLDPAGPAARRIAGLWWAMLILGGLAMLIFSVVLAGALWRRRRGGGEDDAPPVNTEEDARRLRRRWLIGLGVVQPLLLIGLTFALALAAMRAAPAAPGDVLQIEVIAHQWWYEVRYPQHDVTTANEMRLPLGEPVQLTLRSADVVHSFWVPQLVGKTDMLPDAETTAVIHADEPGTYAGRCAEFCGLQHTHMGFEAIVAEAAEVEAWLDAQAQPAAAPQGEVAQRGQEVFLGANCVECHTIAGTPADGRDGPDLTHLASRATLGAATVENSAQRLEEWIRDPHAIKEGVAMPPADLDDAAIDALVTYLAGLQ